MRHSKNNLGKGEEVSEVIVVTGGAGFIGSNFLNYVVPKYPKTIFINIDCLTYAANLKNILVSKASNYRFEKVDIRDREALFAVFEKYRPTGVINFAAESHVDKSIEEPAKFVETNIGGTNNLLSLSNEFRVGRFMQISTDEVYGALKSTKGKFTEKSPLAPNSPYSASKAGADLLVRSFRQTFGLDTVITRSANNYGPNQDKTKLIPLFISRLLQGEKVPIYGAGKNIREWLFVEDTVLAIDLVFRRGRSGEIYNIGGGKELTNLEITKKLLKLTGRKEDAIVHVADRRGHDFRYSLDSGKIKKELGWQARISFEKGIRKTLEYFQAK